MHGPLEVRREAKFSEAALELVGGIEAQDVDEISDALPMLALPSDLVAKDADGYPGCRVTAGFSLQRKVRTRPGLMRSLQGHHMFYLTSVRIQYVATSNLFDGKFVAQ